MSNIPRYACSQCHQEKERDELTVKKCVFLEMGAGARTKRSRVLAWLCTSCLDADSVFQMPAFTPAERVNHG